MVATGVVVLLVYASEAADADAAKVDDPRGAHVEDVGRGPASIEELVQVVGGLMVAADCTGARVLIRLTV